MIERLTKRNSNGDVASHVDPKKRHMLFVNRLAAYEDSGLSPEEVQKMARAKAEGRLAVLPCKVGDSIWLAMCGQIREYIFMGITQQLESMSMDICLAYMDARGNVGIALVDSIGKTVFLSREEAEKALQEGSE